jgi:hypothetical protein
LVYFQICFARKTRTRNSKIYVLSEDWDDGKKEIKKVHPESKLLNQKLKKQFADLQSELLLANKEKVSSYLKPKPQIVETPKGVVKQVKSIYQFADNLISDLKSTNKFGNAWVL